MSSYLLSSSNISTLKNCWFLFVHKYSVTTGFYKTTQNNLLTLVCHFAKQKNSVSLNCWIVSDIYINKKSNNPYAQSACKKRKTILQIWLPLWDFGLLAYRPLQAAAPRVPSVRPKPGFCIGNRNHGPISVSGLFFYLKKISNFSQFVPFLGGV